MIASCLTIRWSRASSRRSCSRCGSRRLAGWTRTSYFPRCTDSRAEGSGALNPYLAAAAHNGLVGGQFRQADGAARVQFLRADADLGSQAEFVAVGEAGGSVDKDAGGIDLL